MREDEDDTESLDIEVRSAAEIAGRLVVLAAVVRRASAEFPSPDIDQDEDGEDDAPADSPEGQRFDVLVALDEQPLLAAAVTAAERRLLASPIGSLGRAAAIAASWQLEALGAIASLSLPGRIEDDPWSLADPAQTLSGVPEPWDDLQSFAESILPPSDEDAAFARERAELWAWRAAIEEDLAALNGRDLAELRQILRETVEEAVEAGLLPDGRDDFVVHGHPFRDADPETKATVGQIAVHRLTALNWLCGFGHSWDSVPVDL